MKNIDRRNFLKAVGVGVACLALPKYVAAAELEGEDDDTDLPPNFIIIVTDDQGYQDMGCYGSPQIKTPNLDRMAEEGMRFTDFYVAAPTCTPSRAALLTGCYPLRVGLPRVLFPQDNIGLNSDEITIADFLKKRYYSTACIGKWHLGHLPRFLPRKHGFDYYFGIPYSNDMRPENPGKWAKEQNYPPLPLIENETTIEISPDQRLLTKRYTEKSIDFIKKNKDKPFFLYLPHTMPHVPLFASEKFRGKSKRGLYGDVIEEIDASTGEILNTLKQLGIDGRTMVFFMSDNGPWLLKWEDGGCALPLRDGKFTTYEGGMRVPAIVRWPGKVPAGAVCTELWSAMDLLPTIAGLVGAKVPTDRVIDGKDIWPLMAGKAGAKSPHQVLYYYRSDKLEAVRLGKWKMHLPKRDRINYRDGTKEYVERPIQLFDLKADIAEKNNLADEFPEVVERLKKMMEKFDAELRAKSRQHGKVEAEEKKD